MKTISVTAHFDGEHILLDEPLDLEPNEKLIVTILPEQDTEREVWHQLSKESLARAYADEEEYSLDDIETPNPAYEGDTVCTSSRENASTSMPPNTLKPVPR